MSKKTAKNQNPEIELVSAYQFADRKGVAAQAVYYRIKITKEIEVVIVGKRSYIDWNKFKHIEFPNAERFKEEPVNEEEHADIHLG